MGFKINKFFVLLCLCLSAVGCGSPNFDKLEGPNVFYQVYPGETDILRIRRTIDEGVPSIQLFDKNGNQLQKVTVAPVHIFLMTSVKDDSVQITYLVGQSDLEMFLPWFKTNKYNPDRIGHYKIRYNYEIYNTYLESRGSLIDSVSVDKKAGTTSLFHKGIPIITKPTYLFMIKSSELQAYNPVNGEYSHYPFKDKDLAKDYLSKILAMYNTSDD